MPQHHGPCSHRRSRVGCTRARRCAAERAKTAASRRSSSRAAATRTGSFTRRRRSSERTLPGGVLPPGTQIRCTKIGHGYRPPTSSSSCRMRGRSAPEAASWRVGAAALSASRRPACPRPPSPPSPSPPTPEWQQWLWHSPPSSSSPPFVCPLLDLGHPRASSLPCVSCVALHYPHGCFLGLQAALQRLAFAPLETSSLLLDRDCHGPPHPRALPVLHATDSAIAASLANSLSSVTRARVSYCSATAQPAWAYQRGTGARFCVWAMTTIPAEGEGWWQECAS